MNIAIIANQVGIALGRVLRPVHTSKFKRIRCASNANWSRSHCALSDAHQLNAHSMRIESIHFEMWIQCASNRIAWAIPDVMNNELIHALERWLLGRRHDLTIFRRSRFHCTSTAICQTTGYTTLPYLEQY